MLGIVLKTQDFREFDQIITFYTEECGKIELVARGSKKITSKQAAHLVPFAVIAGEVVEGQELDYVIQVQTVHLFKTIRKDWEKSLVADYLVKMVDKLIHVGEKDQKLFELLISWLTFLEVTSAPYDSVLLSCLVRVVELLGFKPILDRCVKEEQSLIDFLASSIEEKIWFSPSAGGIICADCKLQNQKNEVIMSLSRIDIEHLNHLYSLDWDQLRLVSPSRALKEAIYQFIIYQTERKIPNWFEFSKALA